MSEDLEGQADHENRVARRRRGAARYLTVRFVPGEAGWELVGPTMLLQLGRVKVTRKDGSTSVCMVRRLGEPYDRHGLPFVSGYLREAKAPASQQVRAEPPSA